MEKLKELKAKYAAALAVMQALLDASPDGLDAENQTKFDTAKTEAEKIEKQISNQEILLKTEAANKALSERPLPSAGRQTQSAAISTGLPSEPADGQPQAIVIPANVKRFAKTLKNFKGADADVQAYKAGKWFRAIRGNGAAQQWCRDHGMPVQFFQDGQTEGINTAGGYLVYDELDNAIIDLALQYGIFRQNARNVPMISDTKSRPRRTGGLTAYFVGESSAGTESTKGWDKVQLIAKKIMVLAKVSSELSEDAIISVADDLIGEIARAFAYKEDICGFLGDGQSTYGGIKGIAYALAEACTVANATFGAGAASGGLVRYGAGFAYSNITLAQLNTVVGLLPTYARTGAKWFCSPLFYNGTMERLLVAAGGNTLHDIINGTTIRKFLGYPVVECEAMPVAAAVNQIPLVFGDLALAADYGDRRQTTIKFSEDATIGGLSVFETDEVAVRGTERFDINVHDVGSTAVGGPIVGLIAHTA